MVGFDYKQKRDIVLRLRKLRRDKRNSSSKLTYRDIEELVWNLPPSFMERLTDRISKWQGKKNGDK